jgi:UDP-glucose 4-epimerase
MRKKVVITGGAGFIGSHLAGELISRDYRVVIVDDLSTGSEQNIEMLAKDKVEFVRGSVTHLPLLNKLLRNVAYVFHLAAITSVPLSLEKPLTSHNVNVTGTLNVLLAAKNNKVEKVVYASSAAVYGDTTLLPHREDMLPNPQSPYAVTKLAGEYFCQIFEQVYKLPTICLRYFNVYGPRQDPNSQYAAVIPIFIKRLSKGRRPVIFGDGEQTRDFVYINDVVTSSILAAESCTCGVFNIGSGVSVTVNDLAKLLINTTGKKLVPCYKGSRLGDIKHSLADIAKAKTLGYDPKYSLERGLRETINQLEI